MVKEIKSKDQLTSFLEEAGSKLVVIDFYAVWCGPCKGIAPKIDELSKELDDVMFCKIDVDECDDLVTEYEINSMPTFVFFKNKTEVDKIIGANLEKIKESIMKHK